MSVPTAKDPLASDALAPVQLRLFGSLRCSASGEPRSLAFLPRVAALLTLVAASSPEPMTRDALAFTLWPDDAEIDALTKLRRHMYSARRAFGNGADPLLGTKLHVAFNRDAVWCDVSAFESARKAGDFDAAVALYSGPLLAGSLDDIVIAERERLQSHFMRMADELLRRARKNGEDDRAFELAARMHDVDPWREDLVRTLMELRAASGDRPGALSLYDRFTKRLIDDMGVAPAVETSALADRLRATPSPEPSGEQTTSLELPFTGRARELAALHAAANDAAAGSGRLAFVCGEAGIGKSRLLHEFGHELAERGWRVATGRTSPGGERRAFEPLLEAVGSDGPTSLGQGESSQRLVFDAIASAVEALAAEQPLLLVCEDVHDCDASTLDALLFVVRRLRATAALVVATYRSDEIDLTHPLAVRQRELAQGPMPATIALDRLTRSDVQDAIAEVAARRPHAAAFAEEFYTLSEGVPLVLQHVIANWMESGERDPSRAAAVLADIIDARISRLSDATRTLLEVAAVAGDSFDAEIVRSVAGFDTAETYRCIDELLERRLLRENGSRSAFRLSFSHHLVRTLVYDTLPPDVRDRRHRRYGTIFAGLGPDLAADAAGHLDAGGDHDRAAQSFLIAAGHFRPRAAYGRAAALADRGVALARDATLRFDLLLEREQVANAQGDRARQRELLAQAAAVADEAGEERQATLLTARLRLARALGDRATKREAMAALATLAERSANARLRAGAIFERGRALYDDGETAAARAEFEQALHLFASIDDAAGAVETLVRIVEAAVTTGSSEEQHAALERLRAASARSHDAALRRRAEECAFSLALRFRDYGEARRIADRLLPELARAGDRERLAYVHSRLGIVLANSAQWSQARAHYARARRIYRELEDPTGLAVVALNEGTAGARCGHLADAARLLAEADERFGEAGDHFGKTMAKSNRANVALHLARYEEAARLAGEARDLALAANSAWLESVALGNLAVAKRETGDLRGALADLEAGIAMARASASEGQLVVDLAEYALTLLQAGRLAEAQAVAAELNFLRTTHAAESLPFYPAYVVALVARAAARPQTGELVELALAQLETFLGSLDAAGRAEMTTSSFVRPLLALAE